MADITNKTLAVLVGLAIAVSLVGLFSLPNSPFFLSGFVVSQGQARLNITETASLNVTESFIDFGNGTIENDDLNCTLTSETPSTPDPLDCWSGTGASRGGFDAVNIGNVNLNVTIIATHNGTNASDFWGANDGRYTWKCIGNGTIQTVVENYSAVENKTTRCVDALSPLVGSDGFTVHLNITIPPNAIGFKNDTITFAASKA